MHFNSEGVADSYQSKLWGVTFIYLVIFACHWFAAIITSVDPRRKNISGKIYRLMLWICPVVSVFVGVTIYGTALNWPWVNINFMANLLLGVIFIVIGNYLPKCRQNYTVGIKVRGHSPAKQTGMQPTDGRKIVGCRRRVDSSAGHSAVDPGISDKSGAHTCGHIYSDDLFLCILSEK